MLKLLRITKDYPVANQYERAIHEITLHFSKGEFVAFFGPSGSGKTTLLNLIGGLDQYTSGDLMINGISTKHFQDADWDRYRNNHVGFIFQNHFLIDHLTILENVELAMTLNGQGPNYCRARALMLLEEVGLRNFIHKRPPFLSGGQKQRVAIARALANDPDIILADEPTGSLDSENATIVMDLIKKIAHDKLVIMVTHNQELAHTYATRIVHLKDGVIQFDSIQSESLLPAKLREERPSKMTFPTALKLAIKNLKTRLFRTFLTAFAGSVGIIGVGLVFAGSAALDTIVETMQTNSLSGLPITISPTISRIESPLVPEEDERDYTKIYPYDTAQVVVHTNQINDDFLQHLSQLPTNQYTNIYANYGIRLQAVNFQPTTDTYTLQSTLNFGPIATTLDNVSRQYDLLAGNLPSHPHQMVLVISDTHLVDVRILQYLNLPIDRVLDLDEVVGATIRIAKNDDLYQKNLDTNLFYLSTNLEQAYTNAFVLEVSGVLRVKEDVWSPLFNQYGVYYTQEFVHEALALANQSNIVLAQKEATTNLLSGSSATPTNLLINLGAQETPIGLSIFTSTFSQTRQVIDHLNRYNRQVSNDSLRIIYRNNARGIMASLDDIIATTNVSILVFALMTILVSGSMIGIISFISVFERTKEIGILRAIGARKKDIARIFNAETFLIGIIAGIIGLGFSLLLCMIINVIGKKFYSNLPNIAHLNWWQSLLLIVASVILSLLSGYLPARKAANKDPVKALTT